MNRAYWMESKTELLKMARLKQYSISTVAFPLMFYCFFALAMGPYSQGAVSMSRYLLATYGAFGVMGATLYAFGGVRMPAGQWLLMWGALVAGAIPFGAIGLAIGSFAGPNSAAGVVNMIYLPMAFCGGLWMPIEVLPKALQHLAPWLPSYHFGQIALAILHVPVHGSVLGHVEALVGFGLIFAGVAWIGQSRDREKAYG